MTNEDVYVRPYNRALHGDTIKLYGGSRVYDVRVIEMDIGPESYLELLPDGTPHKLYINMEKHYQRFHLNYKDYIR